MPPIVKACYANLKKHAGKHPIVLLTDKNIRQYVCSSSLWDNEIFKMVEEKRVTLTQLADFARLCLLYTYGGIWIDSTVWLNKDMDEITSGLKFVSGRRVGVDNSCVPEGKWTTYFTGCSKGNLLPKFIYAVLLSHAKKEGLFIDYFMIDYAFVTAYNNLPYVREMIEEIPPMPNRFFVLMSMLNDEFTSEKDFEKICKQAPLFKLSYKGELKTKTDDGKPTFYAHLIGEV